MTFEVIFMMRLKSHKNWKTMFMPQITDGHKVNSPAIYEQAHSKNASLKDHSYSESAL